MAGSILSRPPLPASALRLSDPAILASALRLPSLCAVCRDWGRQRVCDACTRRFTPGVDRCRRCALQVPPGVTVCGACLIAPPPFAAALTAVDYAHPWDVLIRQFKFHAGLDLAWPLARRLLQAHRDARWPTPALLLPVPLSDERLRERGYNQAWELARRVAGELASPVDPTLLLRVKDTAHQLDLPPEKRAGNVRGAFAVEPRRRDAVEGRSVTLIDDVMTTGATLAEISRVLLQAGASEVRVWVVARTPRPADA